MTRPNRTTSMQPTVVQAVPASVRATPAREILAPQPHVSFPHGVLAGDALLPTARKLPFLIVALAALAVVLLALGALPASAAPHPLAATLLAHHRPGLAAGGLATLVAAIAAYLVI
jgi:hypothetical protein